MSPPKETETTVSPGPDSDMLFHAQGQIGFSLRRCFYPNNNTPYAPPPCHHLHVGTPRAGCIPVSKLSDPPLADNQSFPIIGLGGKRSDSNEGEGLPVLSEGGCVR